MVLSWVIEEKRELAWSFMGPCPVFFEQPGTANHALTCRRLSFRALRTPPTPEIRIPAPILPPCWAWASGGIFRVQCPRYHHKAWLGSLLLLYF